MPQTQITSSQIYEQTYHKLLAQCSPDFQKDILAEKGQDRPMPKSVEDFVRKVAEEAEKELAVQAAVK